MRTRLRGGAVAAPLVLARMVAAIALLASLHASEPPQPVAPLLPPASWIADSPTAETKRWHDPAHVLRRLARTTTDQLPEQVLADLQRRVRERDGNHLPEPEVLAQGWILQRLLPAPVADWPRQALLVGWLGPESNTVIWAISAEDESALDAILQQWDGVAPADR